MGVTNLDQCRADKIAVRIVSFTSTQDIGIGRISRHVYVSHYLVEGRFVDYRIDEISEILHVAHIQFFRPGH